MRVLGERRQRAETVTGNDGGPLGYQLARVVAAIRAQTSQALRPLDLTFPQYVCMRVLDAHPGRSNAELARLAARRPSSNTP
jgi:DNA-binding MarR family transcriptional regulator